jgi:L-aminopeptidase/D-esterase-like protein
MSEPLAPPDGFRIGHWTDAVGVTGCTVVIAPPGSRGGVDVRGGGPGTRETDVVGPYAATSEVTAVSLAGGSAYGLAAADGVMRWCERQGLGYETPAGLVPIVPAAIIYDLAAGDPQARPDAASGEAACEAAGPGVPERGPVGAGTGGSVGKLHGREQATQAGIGYACASTGSGYTVASLAVVNAFGDVIGADGEVLGGIRDGGRTADEIVAMTSPPGVSLVEPRNTTLVCVMTDAPLDKASCGRVARMASAGLARAVDPVFSDVDGDVCFCLASGSLDTVPTDADSLMTTERLIALGVGALAATVTAAAIRDSVGHTSPTGS